MHYLRLQMLQYFHRIVSNDSIAVSSPSVAFSSEAVSAPFSSEASSVPPAESSVQIIVKSNKRKRDSSSFHRLVLDKTGLAIIEAPKKNGRPYSMCTHKPCEAQLQNQLDRWVRHSKVCTGKVCTGKKELTQTAQAMMIQCTAGGEMHRKKTCDTFTTSYWLYKRKASFATAPHVKEVLSFISFDIEVVTYTHHTHFEITTIYDSCCPHYIA